MLFSSSFLLFVAVAVPISATPIIRNTASGMLALELGPGNTVQAADTPTARALFNVEHGLLEISNKIATFKKTHDTEEISGGEFQALEDEYTNAFSLWQPASDHFIKTPENDASARVQIINYKITSSQKEIKSYAQILKALRENPKKSHEAYQTTLEAVASSKKRLGGLETLRTRTCLEPAKAQIKGCEKTDYSPAVAFVQAS
ncbi:MAG: hypothetical protein M1829_006254 [Trizodia sp. TS-e1964]|nr:MAG: hypothetical protein M1829_006254 [Trizodia sp. TS-e1964]